jgi:hypothetical protein
MKQLKLSLIIVLASALGAAAQDFKNEAWLADFAQLKREMSTHYANLEWAVAERGINLKQLAEQTETRLREAKTDAEAQTVLDNFLRNFGDGHLTIDQTTNSNAQAQPDAPAPALCSRLGFENRTARPGLDFSLLDNFQSLDAAAESKYFNAGVVRLSGNKRIGVIRIGLFLETMFPDLCETALSELKLASEADCDRVCENRIRRRASNLLTAAFARQINRLKQEKIDWLMIDLTANGGGTNWYEPAARSLTRKPLRSPRAAFIRHPHWAKNLSDRLADFEAATQNSQGAQQKMLRQAAAFVRMDLAPANAPCDRAPLWENQKISCSLVVPFSNHVLPYAKPGEFSASPVGSILFGGSDYEYQEGVYDGKLLILVDSRTASSSEAFTAMLRDGGAARVLGIPTMGAGCGYTNGGIPTILENSRLKIKMPDCVRLRTDGSNEINGITPDVIVPWRPNDSPHQRVRRTFETLERLK